MYSTLGSYQAYLHSYSTRHIEMYTAAPREHRHQEWHVMRTFSCHVLENTVKGHGRRGAIEHVGLLACIISTLERGSRAFDGC
jgi:hypothetical protein